MSRPATAAHSSSRTHSVDSRASLRRSVSATLAGMCVGSCHEPCASQQPGQLADEERVAAAALPQLGADLGRRLVPAIVLGHRPDVVRREAGQDELLGLAGEPRAAVRTPRCRGTRRAAARLAPSGRGPGTSVAATTARRPSAGRRARPAAAAPRPVRPGTATPPRTAGTGRRPPRRRSSARPRRRSPAPPRRSRTAAASAPRRARPPAGRWPAAPATTASTVAHRCPPNRTRAARAIRPGLIDQRGQHRGLADAGLAADQQELPGAAAWASRSTDPAAASTAPARRAAPTGLMASS